MAPDTAYPVHSTEYAVLGMRTTRAVRPHSVLCAGYAVLSTQQSCQRPLRCGGTQYCVLGTGYWVLRTGPPRRPPYTMLTVTLPRTAPSRGSVTVMVNTPRARPITPVKVWAPRSAAVKVYRVGRPGP